MKLSFSTRGWADRSWDELVSTALEMDFSGIEIHNPITNAAFTGKGGPLDRYNTQATARALRDKGLSMPCVRLLGRHLGGRTTGSRTPRTSSTWLRPPAWAWCAWSSSTTTRTPSTPRSPSWSPTPRSTTWCC